MIAVIVLYAILAATFIFAKNIVAHANPCFIIGFRMILAGLMLLGYQRLAHPKSVKIDRADWSLLFKVSIFHIYLVFVPEFWALQYVSALKATLIYSTTPFIAALLSYLLLNERLTLQKVLGIAVGLCGLIPVFIGATNGAEATMEIASISLPEMTILFGATCAAYAWFLVKRLMHKGYHLGVINGYAMLMGGILSFITAGLLEGFAHPVSNWPYFLLWTAALIISANVIFYNMYGWLLRSYSMTFLTFAGFLCPGFGALFEWLFMGGEVTWHHSASLALVMIGLYIFYRSELKKNFTEPQTS